MNRRLFPASLAVIGSLVVTAPVEAVPGGPIHTLLRGRWICELPGDAEMQPTALPDDSFRAIPDSSYQMADGKRGTYALFGRILTMTSGPLKGRRYQLNNRAMARQIDAAGEFIGPRCIHAGTPTGVDAGDDSSGSDSGNSDI
ncbi:hypothetical protein [Novosphingobium sp. UBA1939]|uniref:hypothetical protein n=1 Tax=Novosphingobium sp. UBA1939 TaxID=1946982 RepID=UPI0025E1334F|nr:hypothetical protein [Novosphingobium sp. UBA1939]